ncbi:efflux RND transporter periplasmic adaptor subunit [Sandaracinobacteroides saxicola]|uniref:Efflux RND transporter periplasmic adaptor subunit n=2 Tax=Sandaracinobacteroides saxicola TaxID=2759707 RepID=A0A7G5IM95_9SPHN|nr:efflux RND transporter periplasmic adaptor subunit [Sandaracinobacteroides saxicola]
MALVRRRWGWALLALIVVALAAWWGLRSEDKGAQYRTAEVLRGDLTEGVTANGTINPVRVINVGTQVSGTVAKLNVDFNDRVTAGQVLLELDPRVYQARLAASEATLAQLRATAALQAANAARAANLRKQDFISQQDYETARATAAASSAQVRSAEAQIVQDRTNLGYTIIRAPVSGVVISRQVDLGQTVAASFQTPTLFTLALDLTKMQIEASIAEADVAKVKVGQAVRFDVDAFGGRQFAGTVRQVRLNPVTQQNVVTYTAIVAVDNPDGALLPGMTANAQFRVRDYAGVLLLPNGAMSWKPADWTRARAAQEGPPNPFGGGAADPSKKTIGDARLRDPGDVTVFVLGADGRAVPRRIRVGASDNDYSVVTAGELKAGDKVIVGELKPGEASASAGPATKSDDRKARAGAAGGGHPPGI